VSVAPKAILLAVALLALAAAGTAVVGRRLARPVELLGEAASRIAEGEHGTQVPAPTEFDAQRIARALASLRREVESRPYAAAFLRDAWHDLKTPLAAIRANVELLEDGALDDPAAARRFVGHVARSAEELDRMLADLVTLARLETASLTPVSPTSVDAIVARAIDRVSPLAAARGVSLAPVSVSGTPGRTLRCDPCALARVLGNLLENAVDASPGGCVALRVDDAGDAICFDVVNEPSFVPASVRCTLFRRATTGKAGGSGLGLAIARAAVEAHGGRVTFVELGPPRVTVRVELPR
jgi:signal transduction histidine kinase